MTIWRAEVVLGAKSGLVKDACVNNFIIDDNGQIDDDGGPLNITQLIDHFYNNAPAGGLGSKLAQFIGPQITRATFGCQVRYYDLTGHLDGSPTGSPTWTDAFTLSAEDTATDTERPCPSEVAGCITLRGTGWDTSPINVPAGPAGPAGDVRPRQRHSGRIFVGPLDGGALAVDTTTGRVSLSSYFRSAGCYAVKALSVGLDALDHNAELSVWSRVAGVVLKVVAAQCDDAPDTQRRRGIDASVRDLVTF